MKMDTLHCAFPHSRLGLDAAGPITPPATPTQDMARTPTFASCLDSQYAQHEFAQTEFADTQYARSDSAYSSTDSQYSSSESYSTETQYSRKDSDSSSYSRKDSDSAYSSRKDSDSAYSRKDSDSYSSTQSLSLSESESPITTPAHTPYSSTPPQATAPTSPRNRKDSFVYDVRLTDEQFLFFVPDLDLVKSHLMFAVREEVEVLKEKITELMERISQLEYENMVLRQYATQEALQQIQQPHHSSNT